MIKRPGKFYYLNPVTSKAEKLATAMKQLAESFQAELDISNEDFDGLGYAASYIEDEAAINLQMAGQMVSYLLASQVFDSAEILEDDLNISFEDNQIGFVVDYVADYNLAPDLLLPQQIVSGRKYHRLLFSVLVRFLADKQDTELKLEKLCLPGARIKRANLHDLSFYQSTFYDARLENSTFANCRFGAANFEKAVIRNCHIFDCFFTSNNLRDAQFVDCDFKYGNFWSQGLCRNLSFKRCTFFEINLGVTDIPAITFEACEFDRCNVSDLNLTHLTELTQAQLDKQFGDARTILPDGLSRPKFWPEKADLPTYDAWLESGEVTESESNLEYRL